MTHTSLAERSTDGAVLQEDKAELDLNPEYDHSVLVAGPPRLASTRKSATSTTMSTVTNGIYMQSLPTKATTSSTRYSNSVRGQQQVRYYIRVIYYIQ
eukprot:5920254-Amphidinium_carterae.2